MRERTGTRVGLVIVLSIIFGLLAGGLGAFAVVTLMPQADSTAPILRLPQRGERTRGTGGTLDVTRGDVATSSVFVSAIEKLKPAVVNIDVFGDGQQNPWEQMFGQPPGRGGGGPTPPVGSGSGFIVDAEQGYVLTNQHVVANASRIDVTLADGRTLEAEKVGEDMMSDVAVLKVPAKDLTEAPLALDVELQQGEWVIAMGNPFREFPLTATVGIISALNRFMPMPDRQYSNLIQTDAAINMGNSGGPLCNIAGEVIGINSAIFSPTATYAGIGFAIPITDAMRIARHLIEDGGVPYLGVLMSELNPELAAERNLDVEQGVLVEQVTPGDPADQAGLSPNDVIQEVNGEAVTTSAEVQEQVLETGIGDKLELTVLRNGKPTQVAITVGRRPSPRPGA